jgi:choline dehydrogenase-like flavoprotein
VVHDWVSGGCAGAFPGEDWAHHAGTTRMGDDPRSGVVDRHCRVHEVENLYLAGASVFPTEGMAPPTLTAMALAIRLAAHIQLIMAGAGAADRASRAPATPWHGKAASGRAAFAAAQSDRWNARPRTAAR